MWCRCSVTVIHRPWMGVGKTGWSQSGDVTEIDVNGNTVKKFDSTTFVGFEPASTVDATGMDTLSISLYRTASSDFEVKLVDYGTDDAWGADNVEVMHYISAADMPVNQWVTIDIPVADLRGGWTVPYLCEYWSDYLEADGWYGDVLHGRHVLLGILRL